MLGGSIRVIPPPSPTPLMIAPRRHGVQSEQLLCTAGATSAEPAVVGVGDAGRCKEVGHDSDLPLVD